MGRTLPLVLAAIGGFLAALPWLDERAFAATWIGLTLVVTVTTDKPPHVRFRRWLLAGLVHVATVLYWYPAVVADALRVSLFSGLLVGLLLVTWDAFRFGVFGYLVGSLRASGGWRICVWPIVWTGLEFVWPHVFPWRIGHTQIGWLPLMQLVEFTGVYGVSFLLLWGSAALGILIHTCIAYESSQRRIASAHALASAAVVGVAVIWGAWRMQQIDAAAATRPQVAVALIQPGNQEAGMRARLRQLSQQARAEARLIVWPESTIDDFSPELTSFAAADEVREHAGVISQNLQPMPGLGRLLLCNGGCYLEGTKGPQHNTAYLIDADEKIVGRYHKRYLMPWGEYIVGQHWIPGVRELLVHIGTRPGTSAAPLPLPTGERIGVLICYEDILAEPARESVRAGADVLVNLMNLSIFGESSAMWGHQQIARPRAIETRRMLLRCGITGSTSVIGPTGRIELQAPPHQPETLLIDAPLFAGQTPYTRWGDLLGWSCLGLTGLLLLWRLFASSRRSAEQISQAGEDKQAAG